MFITISLPSQIPVHHLNGMNRKYIGFTLPLSRYESGFLKTEKNTPLNNRDNRNNHTLVVIVCGERWYHYQTFRHINFIALLNSVVNDLG